MPRLVNIAFNEKSYPLPCDPNAVEMETCDFCVVETELGERVGYVSGFSHKAGCQCAHHSYPKVLRLATPREVRQWHQQQKREQDALALCKARVAAHGLEMRVSQVVFDDRQRKVIFYFTADKRVDFRELVRDLAASFHARIELWQIGVRDETRQLKGMGVCGCNLCCATWLKDFAPVSIKYAKAQDIPFSPVKLAGVCGRLRCCLAYEQEQYLELAKGVPQVGATVQTADYGDTRVIDRNLLNQTLVVTDEKGQHHTIHTEQVSRVKENPEGESERMVWKASPEEDMDVAMLTVDEEEEKQAPPVPLRMKNEEEKKPAPRRDSRRDRDDKKSRSPKNASSEGSVSFSRQKTGDTPHLAEKPAEERETGKNRPEEDRQRRPRRKSRNKNRSGDNKSGGGENKSRPPRSEGKKEGGDQKSRPRRRRGGRRKSGSSNQKSSGESGS